MTPYILSIDVGTSSMKAGAISPAGHLLAFAGRRLIRQERQIHDWHAQGWDRALSLLMEELVDYSRPECIVISGNGPTLVGLDGKGAPLEPVLLWLDGRERPVEGNRSFFLPRLNWLRQERPDVFDRLETVLSFPEYLYHRITGEGVTITPSDEFCEFIWSDREIERYGFEATLFPPYRRPGELVGRVSKEGAERFGLAEGTPLAAGGSDFLMSLVGTGSVLPGRTCDRAGTSEGINHCAEAPSTDPRLRSLPHAVEGLYNVAGILSSTGMLFEWFRGISGQEGRDYVEMIRELQAHAHESDIPWFFPSLHQGAAWEFRRGMFIELGAQHGRVEMGLAVVLSIGFAVREAVEILGENGLEPCELRACGGQAKNAPWNQMKADIVGLPILVPEVEDAELIGNACAGYTALGHFASLKEASEALVHISRRYEPRAAEYSRYCEAYGSYRDAYDRFRGALAATRKGE
ncbi:MAG: xylulokinase [Alkalispirochaetaceae bacterium]